MTTLARLRKGAMALPEVEEGTHFGMVAFYVREKGFATLSKDGKMVHLQLAAAAGDEVLAQQPGAERLVRMGTPIGVSVPLAGVKAPVLDRLLRQAWESRAPKPLAAANRHGPSPAPGGDLPPISNPATRALAQRGISTLDQVAEQTETELLALHGVGPKAIRLLREALQAGGRDLTGE